MLLFWISGEEELFCPGGGAGGVIQIRTINEKSCSLFISKGSTSHNGGAPFLLKSKDGNTYVPSF